MPFAPISGDNKLLVDRPNCVPVARRGRRSCLNPAMAQPADEAIPFGKLLQHVRSLAIDREKSPASTGTRM